jgi:hypothetical protein
MRRPSKKTVALAMLRIRYNRQANNKLFCDWLEMSFNCPHCWKSAAAYQALIRENDKVITAANEKLAHK